ncbi:Nuclear receptor coactivator 5-like 2, partial [Homarus americanus]
MDACKVLAHLLLERRNRGRTPRQHAAGVASSRGRLYRSEPAINALGQDSQQRPLNSNSRGLSGSVESDVPPPPPASRPPPPPLHPPPPVPPHGQPLPQPPQQPLPPVPGHRQEEHVYHQELPPQAPGTCTLPRRGIVREEPNGRYRSPSNPPPASRQPPPYSRHQPPDPLRRPRGPYQPPPPPKIDIREPRERDLRGLHGGRESRDTDHRDVRNSRNLEDTDPRDLRDPRERDSRDHWDGRDFRGSHDSRSHQDPKDVRDPRHFREIRECWERRNSGVPREDHLTSSALPRPQYESWTPQNNRWSTRDPDSGFDSLNSPAMDAGPRSLDSPSGRNGRPMTAAGIASADTPYSQSTEDLLNASRTSPVSMSSVTASTSSVSSSPVQYPTIRPAKQPCVTGASHSSPHPHCSPHPPSESPHGLGLPHHHSTPVGPQRSASPEGALLSDSVYPQHETQPRYAEIPDVIESRNKEDRLNHRLSRDLRDIRDVRDLRDGRDLRESREIKRDMRDFKDNREQRDMRNNSEPRSNKDTRTSRELRDTSLPRDLRDNRDSRVYMEVREERHVRDGETRGYRELSVDVEDHDVLESRQERLRGRRDSRQYAGERSEGGKEVRFSSDPSDGLRVRDAPSFDRRDRDADGADGLQVIEDRRGSSHTREGGQQDSRRGDGCTSSSVSWMEWTQQLQAYVAWVNSQLRKRGRPLISDLRRDLQSGVVFADLIEIISKRIRMTHITSKEVTEGNLKSIMRIILALAAHYKPQSVKSPPHHQDPASVASTTRSSSQPTTHADVGVGPDAPSSAPEKTPNLSANRRAIVTSGGGDDPGAMMGLRRHPSMTGAPATPRDSSPVYENLPRRVAPNRWAYDSLRASHKFQWSGPHAHRSGPPSVPPKSNLDESSDDPLNTSFNTSLNTSLEGEVEVSPGSRSNTRPAALNFWQDLTNRRDSVNTPPDSHPPPPPSQPPPDDPDNPFRYHTIHRMSGRRKLPQIPGAAGPGSRVTTPQEGKESPRGPEDSPLNRSDERPGGSVGDEGSREPEGRSQNSSPATSLVRGPTLDQWPREKNPLDPWEQEDLKGVLRDLNNTRDQLLALQNLVSTTQP